MTLSPTDPACDYLDGWFLPDPDQRWTRGGSATLRLPASAVGADLALLVSNHMPVAKDVTVLCGHRTTCVTLDPAERNREVFLPYVPDRLLRIECVGHRPVDLIDGNEDARDLGIALQSLTIEPPERL